MAKEKLVRLSANQVVSANLRRARLELGLTQVEAAERLSAVTGERWSKSSFSIAESTTTERVRRFDADLLYAMAVAFKRTVPDFLRPPPGTTVTTPRGIAQSVPAQRKTLGGGERQAVRQLLDPRTLREVADLLEES